MADNSRLFEILRSRSGPIYAVLDGAQFDDLPSLLIDSGLKHRSLYLEQSASSGDQLRTMPQFVSFSGTGEIAHLLDMLGSRPAAVFWACGGGEDMLFRHLRTINMVLIPSDTDRDPEDDDDGIEDASAEEDSAVSDDDAAQGGERPAGEKLESVLFRHADANVMAQIVTTLDKSQSSRLLGPADLVVFQPDDIWNEGGHPLLLEKQHGWPPAPLGPLKLDGPSLERMEDVRLDASRRNVAAYLADVAPDEFNEMAPAEQKRFLLMAEQTGNDLGFESEYAHGLWAFLILITGGAIMSGPAMANHLGSTDLHPDDAIEEIVEEIADMSDEDVEAYLS